jgi:poly-gamma-glutamate synthesis protein (capsule biosynthesis protein)
MREPLPSPLRRSAFGGALTRRAAARGLLLAILLLVGSPSRSSAQLGDDHVTTIVFTGDVLLAASVGEAINRNGVHWPWERVRPFFEQADYVIVNLETSVARSTTGRPDDKQFTFRSEPRTLEGLAAAGVDLVTLANNHTLDYGRAALLETLEHLDQYGVEYVGAGANAVEAYAPHIVEFGALRLGFIGVSRVYPFDYWQATPTTAGVASGYDSALRQVLDAVDAVEPTVDALFVLVHWGAELAEAPRTIDRNFADSLLAHGVRGIIGHHPHVLQGFRVVDETGQLVAWSLGNFIFGSRRDETRMSALLFVDVAQDGRIVGARVEPMFIDDVRPRPAAERSAQVLRRLRTLSAPFATHIDDSGRFAYPEIPPPPPPELKLKLLRIP